ncbi:hypothetical protein BDV97DRAFT_91077 [Delphinella strobiligena]|nr:hypothetical protein BDV97DRAFT_91077 [Delphinella strobiligena]
MMPLSLSIFNTVALYVPFFVVIVIFFSMLMLMLIVIIVMLVFGVLATILIILSVLLIPIMIPTVDSTITIHTIKWGPQHKWRAAVHQVLPSKSRRSKRRVVPSGTENCLVMAELEGTQAFSNGCPSVHKCSQTARTVEGGGRLWRQGQLWHGTIRARICCLGFCSITDSRFAMVKPGSDGIGNDRRRWEVLWP